MTTLLPTGLLQHRPTALLHNLRPACLIAPASSPHLQHSPNPASTLPVVLQDSPSTYLPPFCAPSPLYASMR